MQQALPMPFGLKLAGYAAALARSRDRLARLRREALALQFGGAAGTLAALGEHGFGVAERLAALLDLQLPDAPWHSHRDRLAEVAAAFAILAGTCGKIARDVALMMQIEVGEAFEPEAPGRGVSSTLPHQRNPSGAAAALSAATVAPNLVATILAAQVQEHERGLGGWQTEWLTFPALALVTSGALDAVVRVAEGLEIDVERLRANLELSGGQIMTEAIAFALAEKMGRSEAQRLVQELSQRAGKVEAPAQGSAGRGPAREVAIDQRRDREIVHPADLPGLGPALHRASRGREPVARGAPAGAAGRRSQSCRRHRNCRRSLPPKPSRRSRDATIRRAAAAEPPRVAPPLTAPVAARSSRRLATRPAPAAATPMAPVASPAPAPVQAAIKRRPRHLRPRQRRSLASGRATLVTPAPA